MDIQKEKKFKFLLFTILYLFVPVFDQVFKYLVFNTSYLSFLNFQKALNKGFALNFLSEQSPVILQVFSSIFGVYINSILFVILYAYRKNLNLFFSSVIVLFISSINGNLIDKIFLGYVRDFIPITFFNFKIIANVADIFLIVSLFLVQFLLIKYIKQNSLENKRGTYITNPRFQYHIIAVVNFVVFLSYLTIILFLYTFLYTQKLEAVIIKDILIGLTILTTIILASISIFSIYLTHKIIGPMEALKRQLKTLNEDDQYQKINFRKNDFLQEEYQEILNIASKSK